MKKAPVSPPALTPRPAAPPKHDLIKCSGDGCKKRELCLRFTTPPKDKWQAYLLIGINIRNVDECTFFKQKVIVDVPTQPLEAPAESVEAAERDLFTTD